MLKSHSSPYGYKNLLLHKKAEEMQLECRKITSQFPKTKTFIDLADQMDRSARSVKQNIVEGWKRNSTGEYYTFLGYSAGANSELEEDCDDVWRGAYPELGNVRGGVMGEKGGTGINLDGLKFYPLDLSLPPIVQLKLRCCEINFLLLKLQSSLESKMNNEKTLPAEDRYRAGDRKLKKDEDLYNKMLEEQGLVRLENGKVVRKEQEEIGF
jgi:four helix bundle protein